MPEIDPLSFVKLDKASYWSRVCKFNCGNTEINRLLKRADSLNVTTFLFVNQQSNDIIAFCSLCCSSIQKHENKNVDVYPAVEIKLFGVSKGYQHTYFDIGTSQYKYSNYLFKYCINYISNDIRKSIYAKYIILHAIPRAVNFYKDLGFELLNQEDYAPRSSISKDCIPMFMSLPKLHNM